MKKILEVIMNCIEIYKGNVILVYTMGKVGSSSIARSLDEINKLNIHIHNFIGQEYVYFDKALDNSFNTHLKKTMRKIKGGLFYLAFKLSKKAKIITLTRDPISRNLSMMFQGLDRLIYQATNIEKAKVEDNQILQFIFDNYINHKSAINWFETELTMSTGIDIKKYLVDSTNKNYLLIKEGNIEILVLKLETLNDSINVIRKFIESPNFMLRKANTSKSKWYYPLYIDFKSKVRLDKDYIDRLYNSSYIQNFYSEYQINSMKEKWNKNINSEK